MLQQVENARGTGALRDLELAGLDRIGTAEQPRANLEARCRRDQLRLLELSGNRRLHRLFSDLAGEIHLVIALIGLIINDPEQLALTHRPLLDAAESRDGDRLRREIDHHITVAWKEVRGLFHRRLAQAPMGEGSA